MLRFLHFSGLLRCCVVLGLFHAGCAIIGTGVTSMRVSGKTAVELTEQAFELALKDAGLRKGDIDGLIAAGNPFTKHRMFATWLVSHLKLAPRDMDNTSRFSTSGLPLFVAFTVVAPRAGAGASLRSLPRLSRLAEPRRSPLCSKVHLAFV